MIHDQNDIKGVLISITADRDKWRTRAERLEAALREINQYSVKGVAPVEWSHGFKSGVAAMQSIARAALKEEKP